MSHDLHHQFQIQLKPSPDLWGGKLISTFHAAVTTPDATPTFLALITPPDNVCGRVEVVVLGVGAPPSVAVSCSFRKIITFKKVAGVVSLVGGVATVGVGQENAGTAVTFAINAGTISVNVTGIAATNINWVAEGQVFST